MKWRTNAPSNIALIKYMGKRDSEQNIPVNGSLSYTLHHMQTTVELELNIKSPEDRWEPLTDANLLPLTLDEQAQQRFLAHLKRLKAYFDFQGSFIVRSANNFPHNCGLASSASSFAALTQTIVQAIEALSPDLSCWPLSKADIAEFARLGSGSSCRSFYSPWAYWHETEVQCLDLPHTDLIHQVIIATSHPKRVSSSEAHRRAQTSSLYQGRETRAQERLEALIASLLQDNWRQAYQICWQEFWDMHALFSTSAQPFHYMNADSMNILDQLSDYWENNDDGPLVTMDAGPNVHLLWRPEQASEATRMATRLRQSYKVI